QGTGARSGSAAPRSANDRRRPHRRGAELLSATKRPPGAQRRVAVLAEGISMNSLHTAALGLAEKGLAVFPCQPRGKAPACDAGLHAATTDPERINRWWRAFPDLNIGIATGAVSRVFVLD